MALAKSILNSAVTAMAAAVIFTSVPSQADETGAFIGGVVAAKIGSNMRARTQAEQEQAYYAQQQAQQVQQAQAAPPAPAQQTVEQRLAELDKLAAGGYITPEEYKAKKQQILNSM
jgi:hypothetical protein